MRSSHILFAWAINCATLRGLRTRLQTASFIHNTGSLDSQRNKCVTRKWGQVQCLKVVWWLHGYVTSQAHDYLFIVVIALGCIQKWRNKNKIKKDSQRIIFAFSCNSFASCVSHCVAQGSKKTSSFPPLMFKSRDIMCSCPVNHLIMALTCTSSSSVSGHPFHKLPTTRLYQCPQQGLSIREEKRKLNQECAFFCQRC